MKKSFGIAFFCLFIFGVAKSQTAEQKFLESLTRNRNPSTTRLFQDLSNTAGYVSIGVPAGLFIQSLITHDPVEQQKSFYVAETVAAGSGMAIILKYIVNRKRPSVSDSLIIAATDIGSPSFPSGHTSNAFSMAASLSLAYPKWYIIIPSYLWAGSVGFSRLYLGAHYPTDVLAGALIGTGSAFACHYINKIFFSEKNHKKIFWY